MGFDINDIYDYSAIDYHNMRIREVETMWQRLINWFN